MHLKKITYILKLLELKENNMTSLSNRVIDVKDRKTSIRLAPIEWDAIDKICSQEKIDRKNYLK